MLNHLNSHLHLYKKEPRPGRKMGHFTCVDEDIDRAIELAVQIKKAL